MALNLVSMIKKTVRECTWNEVYLVLIRLLISIKYVYSSLAVRSLFFDLCSSRVDSF